MGIRQQAVSYTHLDVYKRQPRYGGPWKNIPYYTPQLVARMQELVKVADVITPNLTEAAILLKEQYPNAPMTVSRLKSWLVRQSELGPEYVLITGVAMACLLYTSRCV